MMPADADEEDSDEEDREEPERADEEMSALCTALGSLKVGRV